MRRLIETGTRYATKHARRAIPFSLSGLIATGVNYAVLYILFGMFSVAGLAAATAAFAVATGVDFMLQKFWTYRDSRTEVLPRQLGFFLLASLLLLLVNDSVFYALADVARAGYLAAQIAATIAVGIVGFMTTRRIFASAHAGVAVTSR